MFQAAPRMQALPFSGIRVMMERANRMARDGIDVIHMEIGRPDFDTPQLIKDALYQSVQGGNVFYTSNYGTNELRQAICRKLARDNRITYAPEEILVTVGVGEGTYAAIAAFLNEGDEILVPDPVWLNYIHVPQFFGAKPVTYSLREENNYQIDPAEIARLITPRTKMLILNTPGNPTGTVQTRETLEALAALAEKNDLIVVSDEIYEKLVYGGELRLPARNARAHHHAQRLFQVLFHDRLASGLRRRAEGIHSGNGARAPVYQHLRALLCAGGGHHGAGAGRGGDRADASGI